MALHSIRSASALPIALSIISSLPGHVLSCLVTRMIERLDEIDGDPDFQQANDDELDGNAAEDDFCDHSGWKAEADCPVADPGEDDDPGGGNVEDEGEPEDGIPHPAYGIDQTKGPQSPHFH